MPEETPTVILPQGTPPQSKTITLPGAASTHALGVALGRSLFAGSVLLLSGELGSGKTTLVQGLAEGLGITELVNSPTFTLINEYTAGRLPLYHLDLYRLQPSEVAPLHLETYWEGIETPLGIVAIEWAERLLHRPSSYLRIHLSDQTDQSRQAELTGIGGFELAALELL